MDRRAFLRGTSAAWLTGYSSPAWATKTKTPQHILSCGVDRYGSFFISAFSKSGQLLFTTPLPSRGHGISKHPKKEEILILARRPDTKLIVLAASPYTIVSEVQTPENRHLYGHGVYSPDGTRFFTTENDFDSGRGVIGIYAPESNYKRLGEYQSGGIGPHQLLVCSRGQVIVVANGGIRTHPLTGRSKLNIKNMRPNLTFLTMSGGRNLKTFYLDQDLHQLSMRHIDINHQYCCAIGMQHEGNRRKSPPLVWLLRQCGSITFLQVPENILTKMQQYIGSVCFDVTGSFVAASCPRGNIIVIWNTDSERFICTFAANNASGIVATTQRGEFIATSGDGTAYLLDALQLNSKIILAKNANHVWDNHAYFIEGS